jgi:hypothetical protein
MRAQTCAVTRGRHAAAGRSVIDRKPIHRSSWILTPLGLLPGDRGGRVREVGAPLTACKRFDT